MLKIIRRGKKSGKKGGGSWEEENKKCGSFDDREMSERRKGPKTPK